MQIHCRLCWILLSSCDIYMLNSDLLWAIIQHPSGYTVHIVSHTDSTCCIPPHKFHEIVIIVVTVAAVVVLLLSIHINDTFSIVQHSFIWKNSVSANTVWGGEINISIHYILPNAGRYVRVNIRIFSNENFCINKMKTIIALHDKLINLHKCYSNRCTHSLPLLFSAQPLRSSHTTCI